MKNSDLTNDFCKLMQNLEILYYEGNIDEAEVVELIGIYAVIYIII